MPIYLPVRRPSQIKPSIGFKVNPSHPLANGLIGALLFNEGGGTGNNSLFDATGLNPPVKISSNPTPPQWTAGKFGAALPLDGGTNQQYVDLGTSIINRFSSINAGTVSVWIYPRSLNNNSWRAFDTDVVDGSNQGPFGLKGSTNNSGDISFFVYHNVTAYETRSNGGFVNVNAWNHIVGTYDFNLNSGIPRIYCNGKEVTYAVQNAVPAKGLAISTKATIGFLQAFGIYGNQICDTTLIYNRALTTSEVQQLYFDPFCFIKQPRQGILKQKKATGKAVFFIKKRPSQIKPYLGIGINPGHPLSQGLLAAYLMNEIAGGKVYDITGNNNTGTLASSVARSTGQWGPDLNFNTSTNASVNCGTGSNVTNLVNKGPFSISCWFNLAAVGGTSGYQMVGKNDNNQVDVGWNLMYTNGIPAGHLAGKQALDFEIEGNGANMSVWYLFSTTNKWYHFVATTDGTITTTGTNLYLNGSLLTPSGSQAISGAHPSDSAQPLYISGPSAVGGFSAPFNGQLDNVGIWSRVLSASEIQQLYAQPFCFMQRFNRILGRTKGGVITSVKTIGFPGFYNSGGITGTKGTGTLGWASCG